MKIKALFDEWRINTSMIAERVGVSQSLLSRKLNPDDDKNRLTGDQNLIVLQTLKKMRDDIDATINECLPPGTSINDKTGHS